MATTKKTATDKKVPASPDKTRTAAAKAETGENIDADADAAAPKKKSAPVKKAPVVAKKNAGKEAEKEKDPEVRIESALNRTEAFIYENGKTLLSILAVLVVVVGGFLAYKYLYVENRSERAGAAMFVAEQHFLADSFAMALNGDGSNAGFLEIIDNFGRTPQGNIARHYAGICFLKLGDLDNAFAYLEKYRGTRGAPNEMINAQNFGLRGDICVQKQEYEKAADLYNRAVAIGDNSFSTPYYLRKLALVYSRLGKSAEAIAALQRIADEFPGSMEGRDVEKYIGAEEQR